MSYCFYSKICTFAEGFDNGKRRQMTDADDGACYDFSAVREAGRKQA